MKPNRLIAAVLLSLAVLAGSALPTMAATPHGDYLTLIKIGQTSTTSIYLVHDQVNPNDPTPVVDQTVYVAPATLDTTAQYLPGIPMYDRPAGFASNTYVTTDQYGNGLILEPTPGPKTVYVAYDNPDAVQYWQSIMQAEIVAHPDILRSVGGISNAAN